jgi:mannose-6-phosphate isomerase
VNIQQSMANTLKIKGIVQHYAWGGFDFLPQLLGIANEDKKPYAEYWLGAHPSAPSILHGPQGEQNILETTIRFPWLLKVLDVKDMLSIQLHPNKAQAVEGFARENNAGIAINAFHRNYKDDNHKPELMVALSEFWLLHGFKTLAGIEASLASKKAFESLRNLLDANGKDVKAFYEAIMRMPDETTQNIVKALAAEMVPTNDLSDPDYWAGKAMQQYGYGDKGIFSIYLFNLFALQPSQGIFQAAGVPHAYLQGQNVELMANSDNVLRAGLTPKHIDVNELLRLIDCHPVLPQIIEPTLRGNLHYYPTPCHEFELSTKQLRKGETVNLEMQEPAILLLLSGELEIAHEHGQLKAGESLFLPAKTQIGLIGRSEAAQLFIASTPIS